MRFTTNNDVNLVSGREDYPHPEDSVLKEKSDTNYRKMLRKRQTINTLKYFLNKRKINLTHD